MGVGAATDGAGAGVDPVVVVRAVATVVDDGAVDGANPFVVATAAGVVLG